MSEIAGQGALIRRCCAEPLPALLLADPGNIKYVPVSPRSLQHVQGGSGVFQAAVVLQPVLAAEQHRVDAGRDRR